jgi:hexosaminidase
MSTVSKLMNERTLAILFLVVAGCSASRPPGARPLPGGAAASSGESVAAPLPPSSRPKPPLIPLPAHMVEGAGSFTLGPKTRIRLDERAGDGATQVGAFLAALVGKAMGVSLTPEPLGGGSESDAVTLRLDPGMSDEGYQLSVQTDRIEIKAKQPQGLFYGVETLRQLLPADVESPTAMPARWSVPVVEIEDSPRFRYRGAHLDVSRHFFPVAFVKKFLDLMALYKLNTFHWHLTDDQGWRIEIKKYPKLTEVGGWRKETLIGHSRDVPQKFDGQRYGGFYTQTEIRDVVDYARRRFITIVPEIEMPGHSTAALAAYPELACNKGPFEVGTAWGIFDDIYCPREKTFRFLEDVLSEVIELFPGPYLHIGGDEVPKARWKDSREVQQLMKREHLKDEGEVQSYFMRRIGTFLRSKGKRFIGWDEILEGGLAPDATVMSWRGFEGGIAAAQQGHDVIMTPEAYTYFDHYQDGDIEADTVSIGGNTSIEKVYAFEPVPDSFAASEAAHVIGAQANIWTEYISTAARAEYMVFPRLLALSEVLWSPKAAKNWTDFAERLPPHFARLRLLGVEPARHFFKVKQKFEVNAQGQCVVALISNAHDPIRFTVDSSDPTPASPLFEKTLVLDRTTTVKAVAERDGKLLAAPVAQTYYVGPATGKPAEYTFPFSAKYAAAREYALTNSQKGSKNFGDGQWLGFDGQDLEATIDLGKPTSIKRLEIDFLRDVGLWVMLPASVDFLVSDDGKSFRLVASVKNDADDRDPKPLVKTLGASVPNQNARYLRVRAKNYGKLPSWHPGAGNPAWLFADELIVE